jgi:hypothetical protein
MKLTQKFSCVILLIRIDGTYLQYSQNNNQNGYDVRSHTTSMYVIYIVPAAAAAAAAVASTSVNN